MKRKLIDLLFALIFLIGFGIFAYPAVSDQWNAYRQSKLISTYEEVMSELEPEDYSREWGTARAFNDAIAQNDFTGDAFGSGDTDIEDTEYWKVLNAAENGVMGYLSIPKIDVRLSVYHGTADDILQTGIGHVSGTKLPIGGDGTHSVLAAHRGLPSAKLFTDLDQMEPGDRFYIHILDEVFAYEVDQILPMIDKDDLDTLHAGSTGRGLCDAADLYALWRQLPQTAGQREPHGIQRRGRSGGEDPGGEYGRVRPELLYALSGTDTGHDSIDGHLHHGRKRSRKEERLETREG